MSEWLRRRKGWFLPLALGMLAPPIIWFFAVRDYIVPSTKYKRSLFHEMSQQFHINENDFIALQRVEDKMTDKMPPSESDWQQVKTFARDKNLNMRGDALRTVSRVSRFTHKQECIDLVNTSIHDPALQNNDEIISSCLSSLYEMRAPNVQEELNKYRNSKGRFTPFVVEQIQQKEARKK